MKVSIDFSKPLPRGRKLKYEGVSNWISFQYERLPKFYYHCGIISHGTKECLKKSNMRNQEDTSKFSPWLRASSPKRRVERRHGRQSAKQESTKHNQYAHEDRHAREGHFGYG